MNVKIIILKNNHKHHYHSGYSLPPELRTEYVIDAIKQMILQHSMRILKILFIIRLFLTRVGVPPSHHPKLITMPSYLKQKQEMDTTK